VLAAFTDDNAERPSDLDQIVRAFCIKVLINGPDAARQFVTALEDINRAKIKLISANPAAPEHERWLLKIGMMATALKNSHPILPERFQATVRELEDNLTFEYKRFCGTLNMFTIRAKFWRPTAGDVPSAPPSSEP
jgi:hypothetical protein